MVSRKTRDAVPRKTAVPLDPAAGWTQETRSGVATKYASRTSKSRGTETLRTRGPYDTTG